MVGKFTFKSAFWAYWGSNPATPIWLDDPVASVVGIPYSASRHAGVTELLQLEASPVALPFKGDTTTGRRPFPWVNLTIMVRTCKMVKSIYSAHIVVG